MPESPSLTPTKRRAAVAAALVVLLGVGGVGVAKVVGGGNEDEPASASCDSAQTVTVVTTREMYQQVQAAANLVQGDQALCATFDVRQREPGDVAGDIERTNKAPDVWIPDSKIWVDNVNEQRGMVRLAAGTTLATSPVVMAVPKSLASDPRYKGSPSWSTLLGPQLPVTTANPDKTTSSLIAIVAANQAVRDKSARTNLLSSYLRLSRSTTTEDVLFYFANRDRRSARVFPTSEQRLASYNDANPNAQITAVVPREGAGELTYTWVTPTKSQAPKPALEALRRQLLSPEGRSQMAQAGLRLPGGTPPSDTGVPPAVKVIADPSLDQSQGAQRAWASLRKDARMLVLIDVSGSMTAPVPGGGNRIQMLGTMASGALDGLPKSTSLGAWAFSTDLNGKGKDYLGIAPTPKPLSTPGYKAQLKKDLGLLPTFVAKNGDTGLYDSISAAYTYMGRTFDPKYINSVVVMTDGKNDDPGGGLDLATLRAQLTQQYDRDKPIKLVTISIGKDTDPRALRQISSSSRGLSYVTNTPQEITSVFVDAFLRRGE